MLAYCSGCACYVAVENVHVGRGPGDAPVHRCADCTDRTAERSDGDARTEPIVPHTGQSTSIVT